MAAASAIPSTGDRIAGEGISIRLKGESHQLRFGMRALLYIEREFDSLETFLDRLQQRSAGKDFIRAICAGMIAGLLHEKPAQMALDAFEGQAAEWLDEGGSLIEWTNAMTRALHQSFPGHRAMAAPKAKGGRKSSPGSAGTTSRRSGMAAPTRRSA